MFDFKSFRALLPAAKDSVELYSLDGKHRLAPRRSGRPQDPELYSTIIGCVFQRRGFSARLIALARNSMTGPQPLITRPKV
jgi:hypothetical protein